MAALIPVFQSSYLYLVELAKSKLEFHEIPAYIKNEFVNNVAVFPISQNYFLLVNSNNAVRAAEILNDLEISSE